MTFSIVGFCEETGMSGVAITTSSIAVGSRCPWVRAKVGAVATQNVTDPSIGNEVLDQMEKGLSPSEAIDKVLEIRDNICLLYTSPSPRDKRQSRMPSSA